MKTYYNRPETNVYLMIDDVANNVVFVNNSSVLKNVIVMTDNNAVTNFSNETSDSTKWVSSNEETFNTIITTVKNMF